jgi:hypothetical protein
MVTVMGMFDGFSNKNDKSDTEESDLRKIRVENERLQERVGELQRIVEAMWNLIRDGQTLSDERLLQTIKELKTAEPEPESCPMCERPLSISNNVCHYCGTRVEKSRVF